MSETTHSCPLDGGHPALWHNADQPLRLQSCSWCGALHPDALMAGLEDGSIELTPTDKSYKVYVAPVVGAEPVKAIKFYWQHLSPEQQSRVVELINERKLKIGHPGHFYVLPYFCHLKPTTPEV